MIKMRDSIPQWRLSRPEKYHTLAPKRDSVPRLRLLSHHLLPATVLVSRGGGFVPLQVLFIFACDQWLPPSLHLLFHSTLLPSATPSLTDAIANVSTRRFSHLRPAPGTFFLAWSETRLWVPPPRIFCSLVDTKFLRGFLFDGFSCPLLSPFITPSGAHLNRITANLCSNFYSKSLLMQSSALLNHSYPPQLHRKIVYLALLRS